MKKSVAAVALAVFASVSLSACSSELSTEDTCVELRAIVADFPDERPSDEELEKIGNQFKDLAKESSEKLKDDVETAGRIISDGGENEISAEDEDAMDRLDESCDLSSVE